jgi:hypothetical protein
VSQDGGRPGPGVSRPGTGSVAGRGGDDGRARLEPGGAGAVTGKYGRGYDEGRERGYAEGYAKGLEEGYERGYEAARDKARAEEAGHPDDGEAPGTPPALIPDV